MGGRDMLKTLTVLLALLVAGSPAWAEGPITKREARTLPSGQVQRRVLAQIGDILDREPANPKADPVRPLDMLWLETKPHGTDVPGLCQIDILRVQFEAFGTPMRDADTPVRATGFTSYASFALLTELKGDFNSLASSRDRSWTPDCADPKAKFLARFEAPDAMTAVDGLQLLDMARKAAPTLGASLTCSWLTADQAKECPQALQGVTPQTILTISRCESEPGLAAGDQCLSIQSTDQQVKLLYRQTGAGKTLLAVRADWTIIIADQRID
jgi:hypothetical protein